MAEEMRRICFKTLAAFGCRLSRDKNRLFSLRSDNEPSHFDTLEIAPTDFTYNWIYFHIAFTLMVNYGWIIFIPKPGN
jgi:hypothetical protein